MGLKASLGYLENKGTAGGVKGGNAGGVASGQTGGSSSAGLPNVKYPGKDATRLISEGFVWKGKGDAASNRGRWVSPITKETWRPDLHHAPPLGPHWDYTDASGVGYRVYQDGRVEPKGRS